MSEIEITAADRDAAAEFWAAEGPFRMGLNATLAKAFASNRIQARNAALEEAARACEAQTEANAKARVDRADDALAFEFRGLGAVIATAIRKLIKGQGRRLMDQFIANMTAINRDYLEKVKPRKFVAYDCSCEVYGPPKLYCRTFMLGMAIGPWIAAIAGLFKCNAKVWCWSEDEGFRAVVLTKQKSWGDD